MWDAIDLSICSINEVCVGIIVANLPPLRKTINGILAKVLPAGFSSTMGVGSRKQASQSHPISNLYSSKGHTKLDNEGDDDSERFILELEDRKPAGIVKTTHVSVRDENAVSSH
jgi:hypothetical protein